MKRIPSSHKKPLPSPKRRSLPKAKTWQTGSKSTDTKRPTKKKLPKQRRGQKKPK